MSRLQVFVEQVGWNDKECDAERRFICRRPCPGVGLPEPPPSRPSEPSEEEKVFSKTMLAAVIVLLIGTMLVMLFGIKFERSKIKGLNQKLLFMEKRQKGYRTSSKGMKAPDASENKLEQPPSL